jgi:hypothetical protein
MVILLSCLSSAVEFDFTHPDSVQIDDQFDVTINFDTQDTFDVKVFVHKSTTDKAASEDYISEIDDGGWRSSWTYIKEAFPEEKSFQVKVISDPGERKICVRLRKTGTDSTSLKCDSITVKGSKSSSEKKTKSSSSQETVSKTTSSLANSVVQQENISFVNLSLNNEKLYLKNPPNSPQNLVTTQKEKTRNLVIYFIIFILAILLILVSFRKL